MHKGLNVALMCLLVSSPVFGLEINGPSDKKKVKVDEVCIAGLAYVVVATARGYNNAKGVAITQAFKPGEAPNRPPQPKTCGN